ncbi:MAG: hypothetical protein KF819_31625 [Labilithrix sp.]|nr:hypothetical protein [Labilithrix sp.]
MERDDEIYAVARADKRAFLPGGHAGRVAALRALLPAGSRVTWNDRSDAIRPRCGFVSVFDAAGAKIFVDEDGALAKAVTHTPSDAWSILSRARDIDPTFLEGVTARLVEPGSAPDEWRAIEAPRTIDAAVALAEAPASMRAAEDLLRAAFAAAAPFGVEPCPAIRWRTIGKRAAAGATCARPAFSALGAAGVDAFGYGAWRELGHDGERTFSFTSHGTDIPGLMRWAAADLGDALRVDAARKKGVVTKSGVAFAAARNPFEPLLRASQLGVGVELVAADRVVLTLHE